MSSIIVGVINMTNAFSPSPRFLFLDFASNMNGSNSKQKDSIASFEDQYSKLNIIDKEKYGLMQDFFNQLFLSKDFVDVHISYPSFNKEPRINEKYNFKYYNNVAIRINISSKQDLVLMGDVTVRGRDRVDQSFFNVKNFIVMDSNIVHMGEFPFSCHVYAAFNKNEGRPEWEDYSFNPPSDREWSNTLFNEDFMLELSKSYVVDKPEEVLKTLNIWNKYLEAKQYLIGENSKNGFTIEKPEFLKGYFKEIKKGQNETNIVDDIRIPFLEKVGQLWTRTNLNDSDEKVLGHIVHDVLEKEFQKDEKNYLRKFNGLTRSSIKIIDPLKKNTGKKEDNLVFKFDDTRISAAVKEFILPLDELSELDEIEKRKIKHAEEGSIKRLNGSVESKISEFKNREFILLIDKFKKEQISSVIQRMTDERSKKIEADLKSAQESVNQAEKKVNDAVKNARKNNSKLQDVALQDAVDKDKNVINANANLLKEKSKHDPVLIEKKYNLDEMVETEISRIIRLEENKLLGSKRSEFRHSFENQFKEELKLEQIAIKAEMATLKEELVKEKKIVRLHTYFEVPISESSTVDLILKESTKSLEGHNNYFMIYDDSGDRILLRRQKIALEKFMNGYVMNPFLATALFCPEAGIRVSDIPVESFYQENLNPIQKKAVQAAVSSNGMFLIQGPPGTGKTQVIAEITTQLVRQGKKVLIASENNKAVDNAFSRLPKDPIIRPLRLINDKKRLDNPYSIDFLLKNFYGNISKTLDERVKEYGNYEDYKENFKEKLDNLKLRFSQLKKLEKEIKDVENEVEGKKKDLRKLDIQLAEVKSENTQKSMKIDELQDHCSQISNFMLPDSEGQKDFSKKLHSILKQIGVDESDDKKASELAVAVCSLDDRDIIAQIAMMRVHEEYFKLIAEKSKEKSPAKISMMNQQIAEYEDVNVVSGSDFCLFELFNTHTLTSEEILKLKINLRNLKTKMSQFFEISIKDLEDSKEDTSHLERTRKRLDIEIDELQENKAYAEYNTSRDKLRSEVRKVCLELHIADSYKDLSDALEIIEDHWAKLSKESKKDEGKKEKLIPIYREISKYLMDGDVFENDKEQYTEKLHKYVNVIGMTCTARDSISDTAIDVNTMGIDVVIIDEVSKISFVELLQPILYGKTVILVGDHKQLPPMYTSNVPADADWSNYDEEVITEELDKEFKEIYEDSFFRQLFKKTPESSKVMLDTQYRMHPQIMDVDNEFYSDSPLKFGGQTGDKEHYLEISGQLKKKIVGLDNHVIFVDCKGKERQESGSTSFTNREEAEVVKKMLELINQNCKYDRNRQPLEDNSKFRKEDTRLSVGVICPYADQASLIRKGKTQKYSSFNNSEDEKFMVKTVDDFQGDERDIIILSMVRTNKRAKFLQEYRRINVAMSRARRLLIIVGNASVLSQMSVKIDTASGNPEQRKVYSNILQKIKKSNGYLSSEEIMGGN